MSPARDSGSRRLVGVWSVLTFTVNRAVTLASTVLIVRLLSPSEYGLFALALAVVSIGDTLSTVGLGTVVIVKPEVSERQLATIFSLMLAVGAVLWGAICGLAPLLALLLAQPKLSHILPVLGAVVFLSSPGQFFESLMQRRLLYRRCFATQFIRNVTFAAVAVTLALRGFGVWSLVFAQAGSTLVHAISVLIAAPQPIRPSFRRDEARDALHDGWGYLMLGWVEFLKATFDNLLLGRIQGTAELGYYNAAYRVAELPYLAIGEPVTRSSASVVVERQRGGDIFAERSFATTLERTTSLTWLVCALLAATSTPAVVFGFGAKWRPTGPVLGLLALWGMVRIVNVWFSWVLALREKQRQAALVTAALFPLFLVMVATGAVVAGAKGVAVAVTVHMLVNVGAMAVLTARYSPFTFRRVFDRVRAAGRATVAAVPVGALAVVATRGRPAVVTLVVAGVATAAMYGAALLMPASSRRRLVVAFRGR